MRYTSDMKKIFILLGHPNKDTYNGALADAYERAALEAGHEVHRVNIGDISFDPILHKGYKEIQELEPDLKSVQEAIRWCDHLVIIHPVWWSSMPSLFKGLFDRIWLPAFAFRFIKAPDGKSTMGWNRLLKGKTSRVIVTLKNIPFVERFMFGDYTAELVHGILRFAGLKVRLTEIGNVEALSEEKRTKWLKKIASLGRRAK